MRHDQHRSYRFRFSPVLALLALAAGDSDTAIADEAPPTPATLESRLLAEDFEQLAADALRLGDARRGAAAFYQSTLGCARCHAMGGETLAAGPDLAQWETPPRPAALVEAILRPSQSIRKGYETVVVARVDGVTTTGLLVEETPERLTVFDAARDARLTIPIDEIDDWSRGGLSVMPEGIAGQLGTRRQFLDLVRYLAEVAEHGVERAEELRPPESLIARSAPPAEYESRVDHAGLISALDDESFDRGEAIYERLCANCHGTHEQAGSLPTSRRFAHEPLKNGRDPYSMYQTLTRGFGMMTPQPWMVPRQKYDVIHYLREEYLREDNPSQYQAIDANYLASLPTGDTWGPEPVDIEPWVLMDYGPTLTNTYEIGDDGENFAYKGIAARLDAGPGGVARGRHWAVFDHDTLRTAAVWSGEGFINWNGIHFNDRHAVHPRVVGEVHLQNVGPGWAHPVTQSFDDPRLVGRDGRRYGPLPRDWAHYEGLYHFGLSAIVAYTVGETNVLEMPGMTSLDDGRSEGAGAAPESNVYLRTLNIGPRQRAMIVEVASAAPGEAGLLRITEADSETSRLVAMLRASVANQRTLPAEQARPALLAGVSPPIAGLEWSDADDSRLRLVIPAGEEPLKFTLWTTQVNSSADPVALARDVRVDQPALDLAPLTEGGPPRWPETITTPVEQGEDEGPFAVDALTPPAGNPWLARVRLSGLDFYPDERALAVCAWDGDVWKVSGIDAPENGLTWRRIASGLFQPLGLKIIDGKIHVTCRDQIVVLHDLNGDGETDYYENFNSDHQVTDHFHEFAMDLQTDAAGNLYYTKAARHALPALVPQHGTLLRVSPDGQRSDILATGFRAPNGVAIEADGAFFISDQEGHWTPKNRINWVRPGHFYGNMLAYHDVTDQSNAAMQQPLCWITNEFDRSPAQLLRVPGDAWGPLAGSLLSLSYGYGKIFIVPHEMTDGHMQGGMSPLPIPRFPTGVMRGRFHPITGHLYACGLFAWASDQQQPGGLYRVRYTGQPLHVPVGLSAKRAGLELRFSEPLDPAAASDAGNYSLRVWSLKRSARYGSEHHDERGLDITSARLADDGRTVMLDVPDIAPTWCLAIHWDVKSPDGRPVVGELHGTIHHLAE